MHTECRPQMCRFTLQYSFAVVFTLMFITSTLSSIETAKSENTAIKHNDMNDQGMFFIDDPPVSDGTIEGSGYPDEGDDEDEDKDDDPGENGSGDTPFNEDDDFSASGDGEISPEPTDLSHSSTLASSTSTTTSTTTTTTTSTTTTPLSTTMSDKPTKKESTKKPIFSIDEEVKFRKNSKDAKESDINNNKITDHNFVPESAETSTKNTISTTPKSKEPSHPVDSNNQGIDVSILGRKQEAKPFSFLTQPGILAAVIGGAVVGLLCAILLVMFIVYRMRKKDEGSYALDEPKMSPAANPYAKGNSREFYA